MANIKKIVGKTGTSYKITETKGRDSTGKQIRHYKTWTPPQGMTNRQADKAAQKAAFEFENSIEQGYLLDNRQIFAEYAEYVLTMKEREGRKRRTLDRYQELLIRINASIGHLKIADIRPQHLNAFYAKLSEPGVSAKEATATALPALLDAMKGTTRAKVAQQAGVSATTVTTACNGKSVALSTANSIATALGHKTETLFTVHHEEGTLAAKTILEHHRLIRTILSQAEKELLVPYNAAAKATPPKADQHEVNYFQVEDVARIREALETEPLKWRVITHLLLITGCRRGEIMGLKWSKVNFETGRVKIDTALLYSPKRGIYEDTTKTRSARYIKLPRETLSLLKQYGREYAELQLKNGDRWQNTGYLFVKDNGDPMLPDTITAWLRKFSVRHSLPHINPHAFRHTMASVLIANGQDIVSVSKRLGHTKVSTTTDIYSHIIQEADDRASDCLADVLLHTG